MKKRTMTLALLVVSAALIAIGIAQNQPASVWSKAIRICLECVGLG